MKYPLLVALLGLTQISFKAGIFGGEPSASFTKEQIEAIEQALRQNDNSILTQEIEKLKRDIAEQQNKAEVLENAVSEALQLNGLEVSETVEESIRLLGTTCKKYGEKKAVHTLAAQDGKEANLEDDALIDGYLNPNDEHNKLLTSI